MDRIGDEGETSTSVARTSDDSSEQIAILQHQIYLLQKRVSKLEQQEVSLISTEKLDAQMSQLLHPSHCIFHCPNTVDHFDELSVDTIIRELQTHAPDLYDLFNVLGQTNRHDKADNLAQLSKVTVITSLTTLLKCRSVQVLGIQLLLTFMLFARSTSRQLYSDAALSGDHQVSINTISHPYFPIICINIMDLTHPSLCMHTCTCTCTCNQSIMIFCR